MIYQQTTKIADGIEMPTLGYGTWQMDSASAAKNVSEAIKRGFRHIDTALAYDNEMGVGRGIKTSGLHRSQIFVTTKVPAESKSVEGAIESIKSSLKNLDLEYIDLLLIHAPMPWDVIRGAKRYFKENVEVWKVMEKFKNEGLVRAIGVSNFNSHDLDNIIDNCDIAPMVNQIKVHPGSSAATTLKATIERGIVPMAYSPMGHGKCLTNKYVTELASKYNVSPAQLCLQYSIQKGCCPVMSSGNPDHMEECLDLNFIISDEDIKFISCLGTMKNLKKHLAV